MFSLFFFNDTATTEIYTLSLHDALPIFLSPRPGGARTQVTERENWNVESSLQLSNSGEKRCLKSSKVRLLSSPAAQKDGRSEEHTSELQSLAYLVCRLLLEKKKQPDSCR